MASLALLCIKNEVLTWSCAEQERNSIQNTLSSSQKIPYRFYQDLE